MDPAGAAEARPVKTSPVLYLEIDEQPEDYDHRRRRYDPFCTHSFHELLICLLLNSRSGEINER